MSHKTGDNLVIRCMYTNMKNQTEAFFIFDLVLSSLRTKKKNTYDYGHATNHLIYCIAPSINIFYVLTGKHSVR